MNNKQENAKKAKPNLKKNFIYNFISQILTLVIPLITTPYLSRILGEEGNGQISYSLSIVTVFILFASLGFTTYGQREIAKVRDDKEATSKVFWEITILKAITTIISSGFFFALLYTTGFKKCNNLILIFSIELLSTIFDVTFFFQGEENFKSLALRTIFLKVLGLILIFCFIKTSDDTWIYALCLSISYFLSYVIMWPSLKGKISFVKLNTLSFKKHIGPTLRIFVPQLAVTIYSVMDKLMIGWFATNSDYENGCYEQAYKINSVALILVTVISSVLAPRNTYDYKSGNLDSFKNHINFAIHYTWMMGLPLIAGFAVLSNNLSSWYLGEGYAEVPLLMQIMSIRFVCSGISELCGNQIFIAIGKEKYYTIATCVAAVVNITLNYFFIKLLGATGAAISTAVCEFLVASILATIAIRKKYFSFKDLFSCSWKYLISALVMLVTIYFIQKYLPYTIWSFLVIMFTGAIEYFLILLALRDSFLTYWLGRFINKFQKKKESTK